MPWITASLAVPLKKKAIVHVRKKQVRALVDKITGKAKEVAGSVLGNDDLKEEGQLHQQKADAEVEAARLTSLLSSVRPRQR